VKTAAQRRQHAAEVISDRLLSARERWQDRLSVLERNAIMSVRVALARIAAEDAASQAERQGYRLVQDGKQIVRFGKYSYTWDGDEPLAAGDRCLLPANWLFKEETESVVTGFGTDYDGALQAVVRLVKRGPASSARHLARETK
jgi:hypothetical protein